MCCLLQLPRWDGGLLGVQTVWSYQRSKILWEVGRNNQLGLMDLQGKGIFHSVMSVCAAMVNDRKAWWGPVLGLPEVTMPPPPHPQSVRTLVSKECAHHSMGLGEWEYCKVKENGRARWKGDSKHLMNSLPAGELGTSRLSPSSISCGMAIEQFPGGRVVSSVDSGWGRGLLGRVALEILGLSWTLSWTWEPGGEAGCRVLYAPS